MGLNLQEQDLVRQALDQWSEQESAQVQQEQAQDQQSELGQWLAQDLARVRQARVQVLMEQVLAQLAQVEQVQAQVVQLAQALVEKSQGKALAEAALVLAQEQRRLVRLQLAQV